MINISSQTVLPLTSQPSHRFISMTDSSPIAVRNKIKAIQSRRPRITVPDYYDSTEIRPINELNSRATFSVITAERLVDRSRTFRQRPSFLSSGSFATQSNSIQRMPEIPPRRRHRPSMIDRHETFLPVDSTKTKSSPPPAAPPLPTMRTHRSFQQRTVPTHSTNSSDLDDEQFEMDEEFREYFDRAIIKCADWLMKYVFNEDPSKTFSSSIHTERIVCV